MSFRSTAATLFKARFPFISVTTWEEDRVLDELSALAQDEALIRTRRKLYVWSLTAGIAETGQAGRNDTRAPVRALEVVEKADEPAIFVFKDMHVYFSDAEGAPSDLVGESVKFNPQDGAGEAVSAELDPGYYLVLVDYYLAAGGTYKGTAKFTPLPDPA